MLSKKSESAPPTSNMESRRDSGMSRKFFQRLSSFKVDYEKDQRRTVQRFQSTQRDSSAVFLRDKIEIMKLLKDTQTQEDLEQLYIEIFCVLFPKASDRERPDSKSLIAFLQKLFFFEPQTHADVMHRAKSYQIGDRVLFLEVVEARNLPGMDLDGLSDPFCTLFVTSKDCSKRTKVIHKSLNPQWNETFKLLKEPHKDYLRIDVWDHDPQERLRDKLKKYKDITSARGIGSFVRDLGHGRNSAQEFIGRVSIPLKDVTSETTERWWSLGNTFENGEIYLRLALGVDKDRADAVNSYQKVLQLLIINELGKPSVMVPFQWDHITEAWGEYILRQMHTVWGITAKDILLGKYLAYTKIHAIFPLSGRINPPLIFEVFESAINSEYNANDVDLILQSSNDLLQFSVTFVEKIHEFFSCIATTSQLYYILKTLEILGKSVDKLRMSCDSRTTSGTDMDTTSSSIAIEMKKAIRKAARTKFGTIVKSFRNDTQSPSTCEDELLQAKQLLQIGQLILDDLEKGLAAVDKDFKMILKLDFHRLTYEVFDTELEKMMKPFVTKFCDCLKSMCEKSTVSTTEKIETGQPEAASTFLHLFLCLRKFSELSPSGDVDFQLRIKPSFHFWFYPGVSYLFDLMSQVWVGWMRKAVQADYEWQGPSHENVMPYPNEPDAQVTSSAVDSVQIFTQIQTFWTTLNWPDPHQSVIFANKLIRELCGFSVLFANLSFESLQKHWESKETETELRPYEITSRLCRTINNINFVGDYTKEIAVHFNLQRLLIDIQYDSTDGCLMEKHVEIQKSGLHGVIDNIIISAVKKMSGWSHNQIKAIVQANDEKNAVKYDSKIMEFLNYQTVCLRILDEHLLPSFFVPFLAIIWENVLQILKQIIALSIREGKSWEHFGGLKNIVDIVKGFFETAILRHSGHGVDIGGVASSLVLSPNYSHVIKELEIYAIPVSGIKSRYLGRRYEHQRQSGNPVGRGLVCIHAVYQKNQEVLLLEILNASKLPPADSNGKSDPFVQVGFVPEEDFPGLGSVSTKVVKEELYPIFEEKFNIKMTKEMKSGGYMRLIVYDHDFLKKNEFLGEAFLPLTSIETTTSGSPSNLRNILLPLTAPSDADVDFFKSLMKNRVDKELKRFLDCEREKLIKPTV